MRRFLFLVAALAGACSSSPSLDVPPAPTTGSAGRCATCHMSEFTSAPDHQGVKPATCATCHTQSGWHSTRLEHAWPLTGAHARAPCFYCHKGQPRVFLGTPRQCYGCHEPDYVRAPRHVAEHFSTRCQRCHTTQAWNARLPNQAATSEPSRVAAPRAPAEPAHRPTPMPRAVARPRPTRVPAPRPRRRPDVTSGASRRR